MEEGKAVKLSLCVAVSLSVPWLTSYETTLTAVLSPVGRHSLRSNVLSCWQPAQPTCPSSNVTSSMVRWLPSQESQLLSNLRYEF